LTTVLYVLGTRPEVIRSARTLQILAAADDVDLLLVNTGQHYDERMMGALLEELDVPPISFDLRVGSDEPAAQTARIVTETARVISDTTPDTVCVFGDTNSTLGAAVAAAKAGVGVVHVEAGCRSFDPRMPEELNRRAVDHISSLLLAVSELAAHNLDREHVMGDVRIVGDPQYDIFLAHAATLDRASRDDRGLITLHRQENADDPARLARILDGIASGGRGIDWIFPVHPRTARALSRPPQGIELVEPLLYAELLATLATSRVCVTDSGGLQKEAFWARVPCVTVRETTEWMETVAQGANELAAPSEVAGAIERARAKHLADDYDNPYGDGRASERIADLLRTWRR
jgi:UDP-N-acetylglucosamine 2-epimerase